MRNCDRQVGFWLAFILAMAFVSYCIIEGTKNWPHEVRQTVRHK